MSPKRSDTHPYQRLQVQLSNLLASMSAGEQLPAEPELARQMGVSRATLREAMRSFEGQGLIRRRQGVGTFAVGKTPVIETGLEVLESIENQAKRIGLAVTMGDFTAMELRANNEQAAALNLPVGAPLIQVGRTILADDRPVAYLIDTLPIEFLSPQELQQGFSGSVLDFILRRGNIQFSRSVAEIRPEAASAEVARALEIQRGDVLLMFTSLLYTIDERPIDYSASHFLPGYFRFHVVRKVGQPG
jgi:GntR family transcriptional regulator